MAFEPIIFRVRKNTKHRVEAMQFGASNTEAMAVYQWIERNSAGSFDVNAPMDPLPTSGVSIDASNGKMVIATRTGIIPVDLGDWVVKLTNGEFNAFDRRSFHDTYVRA